MSKYESIVILGPVVFTDREVPDTIPFGGRQAMAIHKNLGGHRTIDMMGPDPDPISWSGLFLGKDASKRARLLDALKDTGAEMRLTWGSFNFLVVISQFQALYKHEWEVHYKIEVQISKIPPIVSFDTISAMINSDWTSALNTPALPTSISGGITTAQSSVNAVAAAQTNGDISNASLAGLQPAISAVETAYYAIDNLLNTTEASIQGVSLDAQTGGSTLESFNNFSAEANNAASSANLRAARGYVGRIVGNLTTLGG